VEEAKRKMKVKKRIEEEDEGSFRMAKYSSMLQ